MSFRYEQLPSKKRDKPQAVHYIPARPYYGERGSVVNFIGSPPAVTPVKTGVLDIT